MKAVIVEAPGSPGYMKYTDIEKPVISSKQVLIRVHTTSVNFADIKSRHGRKGVINVPFVPGLEASGIVEDVGTEVASIRRGDRVLAFPHHGSYAEYVAADEDLTFRLPEGIDLETAGAGGIVSFLSFNLLSELARMQAGDHVLIHSAAGGVGTTAVQMAKALGAGLVIGVVGHPDKISASTNAGADHVICCGHDQLSEQVLRATGGHGADIILDSVGGDVTKASMNALARYGRLVIFGNSSGEYSRIETGDLHASCRSVLGYSFGTTRKERPESLGKTAKAVFDLLEAGKLKVNIGKTFRLHEAALAHDWVESRQSTGKVILSV